MLICYFKHKYVRAFIHNRSSLIHSTVNKWRPWGWYLCFECLYVCNVVDYCCIPEISDTFWMFKERYLNCFLHSVCWSLESIVYKVFTNNKVWYLHVGLKSFGVLLCARINHNSFNKKHLLLWFDARRHSSLKSLLLPQFCTVFGHKVRLITSSFQFCWHQVWSFEVPVFSAHSSAVFVSVVSWCSVLSSVLPPHQ